LHPNRKKLLANQLETLAKSAVDVISTHLGEPFKIFNLSDGPSYALLGDDIGTFNELIDSLLNDEGWGSKYSEDYLVTALASILAKIIDESVQLPLAEMVDELVRQYESHSIEFEVYIPLTGIGLENQDISIGSVRLILMSPDKVTQAIEQACIIVDGSTEDEADKEKIKHLLSPRMGALTNRVCAVYKVVAEPGRARERAIEEARRALEILQCSLLALYGESSEVSIGLEGEVPMGTVTTSFALSTDSKHFQLSHHHAGPKRLYALNDDNLSRMKTMGLLTASEMLAKGTHLTDFEETILRGIHWTADANVQAEPENALLSLITTLETYLTPRDREPIVNAIAEGVALILGEDLDTRRQLKRLVKNYYNKRSALSHGGKTAVLRADVVRLTIIVGKLTTWMIKHTNQFTNVGQLLEWLEDVKLSGPIPLSNHD
jgi:hypothetical protein